MKASNGERKKVNDEKNIIDNINRITVDWLCSDSTGEHLLF